MTNEYKLDLGATRGTTGTQMIGPDINAYNEQEMTPLHVAFHAGNIAEAEEILATPGCDPTRYSKRGFHPTYYIYVFQNLAAGNAATAKTLREMHAKAVETWEEAHPKPAPRKDCSPAQLPVHTLRGLVY
jgi:hypothetical protein